MHTFLNKEHMYSFTIVTTEPNDFDFITSFLTDITDWEKGLMNLFEYIFMEM